MKAFLARERSCAASALLGAVAALAIGATAARAEPPDATAFRVCADPNNLPFSNRDEAGFENKLAELIAADLGQHVAYTWWPQRRAYIRLTLKAGQCDVIMGIPRGLDMVETTHPYYRSTYVFVSKADRGYDLHSIKDARLRALSVGVQLIGNDGYNTPPAHALSEQGIVKNLVGYSVYGDYQQPNPPADIMRAVADGQIDIAAVWGPLAGFFARRSPVPLAVTPITDTEEFAPLRFQYDIAIGVRKGDDARRDRIDAVLNARRPEIIRLLRDYGVPLVSADDAHAGATQH